MSGVDCPEPDEDVEARINRVLTQYRESPNLLFYMRTVLRKIEEAFLSVCDLPRYFEIDDAVGDQLTLIGERLGWPRCHCVCTTTPIIGFACDGFDPGYPIVGFCEGGTWLACADFGVTTICMDDDEIYRKFVRARIYQTLNLYDIDNLTTALQVLWGPTATVLNASNGRIVMAPGRDLTTIEQAYLKLVPRVLPVALGIAQRFHFDTNLIVAGFGTGWGGFCQSGGDDTTLETDDGVILELDDDSPLEGESPTIGAPMMCQTDVKPYSC